MRTIRLVVLFGGCALIGCGTAERLTITFSDQASVPNCGALSEQENVKLRPSVVTYFRNSVGAGVQFSHISVDRGVLCDGRIVFAITTRGAHLQPQVWFVEMDTADAKPRLIRPE